LTGSYDTPVEAKGLYVKGGVPCRGVGVSPVTVTVQTDPPGLSVVVDAATYVSPQQFSFTTGTAHDIGVFSGQRIVDTLYVFSQWSDAGADTHAVTIGSSDTTFTAYFKPFYNFALIDSIVDVPADQGGWVRVHYTRSRLDDPSEETYPIAAYDIFRRVDNPVLISRVLAASRQNSLEQRVRTGSKGNHLSAIAGRSTQFRYIYMDDRKFVLWSQKVFDAPPGLWEELGQMSAQQQDNYLYLAPTLEDSSETLTYSVFYISANTTTPAIFFDSPPDSGYSVDNIAPAVPEGFTVAYNTGSGNQLAWAPCGDPDFQYFKIYRDTESDFTPSPDNLVGATIETQWTDPEYDGWLVYYRIAAVDYVGNESDPTDSGIRTGVVEPIIPERYALHQNLPNPFNPVTTIRYDVPAGGGKVSIKIYDVNGRLVRILVNSYHSPGRKSVIWNGRNETGGDLASGVYFYLMQAKGYRHTLKMVLLR
jgi:hypothetical protein